MILKDLNAEKDKTISELEKSLSLVKKELDLEKRENEINQKMLAIKDQEIAGINRNFDQLKDVSDRALKLAEMSKPKSNWELQGLIGLAALLVGVLIAR